MQTIAKLDALFEKESINIGFVPLSSIEIKK
jgi:hypothetical protein